MKAHNSPYWSEKDLQKFVVCFSDTSKEQSAHYPYRIVTLKEIMSKLTILRDRTIAIMWKNVLASGDVKDNLGMMSRQMMDEW